MRFVATTLESSLCARPNQRKSGPMKKAYDFSKAKRGAVLPAEGKTRITIYLDDVVIDRFKSLSEQTGKGYQTLANEAVRSNVSVDERQSKASATQQMQSHNKYNCDVT